MFRCKEYNHLILLLTVWWCPCVESSVVGRGCLLWPVCSLGNTLLVFDLLHFVFQSQICLLFRYLLTSYFCTPIPYNETDIFFWVFVLEDLVSLQGTSQLQLLQHYWSGHRLGLLWYWMVCLGQRSFCHFWDCIQALHFRLFCWPWWLLHLF